LSKKSKFQDLGERGREGVGVALCGVLLYYTERRALTVAEIYKIQNALGTMNREHLNNVTEFTIF